MELTEEDIDLMMRTLYDVRSGRREPMSDEDWTRKKGLFKSSMTVLREDAIRELEEME